MKYLKKFQTNDDYQAFKEGDNWVTLMCQKLKMITQYFMNQLNLPF